MDLIQWNSALTSGGHHLAWVAVVDPAKKIDRHGNWEMAFDLPVEYHDFADDLKPLVSKSPKKVAVAVVDWLKTHFSHAYW